MSRGVGPRKPLPLKFDGFLIAECKIDEFDSKRRTILLSKNMILDQEEGERFTAWLEKALAWRNAK